LRIRIGRVAFNVRKIYPRIRLVSERKHEIELDAGKVVKSVEKDGLLLLDEGMARRLKCCAAELVGGRPQPMLLKDRIDASVELKRRSGLRRFVSQEAFERGLQ